MPVPIAPCQTPQRAEIPAVPGRESLLVRLLRRLDENLVEV